MASAAERTQSARDAYRFLVGREGSTVTYDDVAGATGGAWSASTVRNYRSKKWRTFTAPVKGGFRVGGISGMGEDEFVALQSQVQQTVIDERIRVVARALEAGEGQAVEFKESIPGSANELAKEIAAFATSNDGTILVGVTDDGAVVGCGDARERFEGIVKNVSPPATVLVDVVSYEEKPVVLIRVRKGAEPLYYSADRPYVRQGTLSRPATPGEVKALVLGWQRAATTEPG